MCDCKKRAESKRQQDGVQAETNKRRAGSPLESTAKRGRNDRSTDQSLELVSQFAMSKTSPASTVSALVNMGPTLDSLPVSGAYSVIPNPMNEPWNRSYSYGAFNLDPLGWNGAAFSSDTYYYNRINMDENIGNVCTFPGFTPVTTLDSPEQTVLFAQRHLYDIKPAHFLAIRETQGR